jgi:hypothetical protein
MHKLIAVIIALGTALPVSAGALFTVDASYGGSSSTSTIEIEGSKMKMNAGSADSKWNGEMIFNADRREMIVVNHDDRSYFVIDHDQMRELSQQINQAMSSMEQALAALPEGQRAKMEQMMKSKMPAMAEAREPSQLKRTGVSDSVNGFDCDFYEVWRSGVRERELCVTDWSNVAGGRELAETFTALGEMMREMLDSLPKMANGATIGDATFEHMNEMGGFPVISREYGDDGVLDGESRLVSAAAASFAADDFEPPKKYKRRDLMKGMK